MKTMKTPFKQMSEAVPADIQQEVNLEFAISNRINDLMMRRCLTKLESSLRMAMLRACLPEHL